MSKPNFLNHEIVFNPTGNEFNKARDQLLGTYKLVKVEDWEYKFIKQPKLTIPKKIADKLDNEDADSKAVLDWVFATEMIMVNNEKALERREDEILKRRALVSIYGASKALGVELVEVTDE